MLTIFICVAAVLMTIGAFTIVGWARELWRTRKDKGYSTRDTGAF
jgi:hypothetical protein